MSKYVYCKCGASGLSSDTDCNDICPSCQELEESCHASRLFDYWRDQAVLLDSVGLHDDAEVCRKEAALCDAEPPHPSGCVCADCSGAELTAEND